MRTVRYGLVVAIALSTVAFTSTAMAGKGGLKGANQNVSGLEGEARKNDPFAVSPGQPCPQDNKSLGTPSNPIPGAL